MAYSGTVGQTVTTVAEFIDEGSRRCDKLAEELTGEQILSAKRNLYLLLSHLGNKGIDYWTINTLVVGFNPGQYVYSLPVGTIDVLQILYRQTNQPTGNYTASSGNAANAFSLNTTQYCQQTAPGGWIEADFSATSLAETIVTFGILPYLPSGPQSWTYSLQYSLDNVNWTTLYTTTQTMTDYQWVWQDITASFAAPYWRLQAGSTTTLSVREFYLGDKTTEVQMSRLNRDDYSNLPNKGFEADQPFQFYMERYINPDVKLWPVPSNTFKQMVIWYSSHIQDVGSLSNQIEIPQRWQETIQAGLAYKMSLAIKGVPLERVQFLKQEYEQSLFEVQEEERDRSPVRVAPNISVYTK